MKAKVISGAVLAAAAVSLALAGSVSVAEAHSVGHTCKMSKGQCGGKMKCMTKTGVCKHHMHGHSACHHRHKSACKTK